MQENTTGHVGSNAHFDWDEGFDPVEYVNRNYRTLRADDAAMYGLGIEWFARSSTKGRLYHGVDVGAGSNLGPALLMLPFCGRLTLFERSRRNVNYLQGQVQRLADHWEETWVVIRPYAGNRDFAWVRRRLSEVTTVVHGSVFRDLHVREWTMGTMSFVAESLTDEPSEWRSQRPGEFEKANRGFLQAMEPGSPFYATYMEPISSCGGGSLITA
jgi:hypothetical protein